MKYRRIEPIEAKPMTWGEYCAKMGITGKVAEIGRDDPGYRIRSGCYSTIWWPKKEFEEDHEPIE